MKENNNLIASQRIHQGRIVTCPEYKQQPLEEYNNNPFIEALPNIFSDEEVARKFTVYPAFSEDERNLDNNIRFHMVKRLKDFVQPLDIHFDIERSLSTMLRRGYIARNPMSSEYLERLRYIQSIQNAGENTINSLNEIGESLRTTAESFSLIGISGMGKSLAIERILMMYPQVIIHSEYKGKQLTRTQLVWLKIDCPYDGSISTLCKTFFMTLDEVLGTTNYYMKYGNSGYSSANMMVHMSRLAAIHGLGLLVVDEIQHLISKRNSPEEMLNFIVTLVNTTGVPIVLVGTPKAKIVFEKELRQSRRVEGIAWDRMNNDEIFDFFLETIWEYQWVKKFTPLTMDLRDAIYEESQGITALAVNLFMFAQIRAITSGKERVEVGLIREVAKNELRMVRKMIQALQSNNQEVLAEYDDIVIDFEKIIMNSHNDVKLRGKMELLNKQRSMIRESQQFDLKERALSALINLGIFKQLTYEQLKKIIEDYLKSSPNSLYEDVLQNVASTAINFEKEYAEDARKRPAKVNTKTTKKSGLLYYFDKAKKEKREVYEVLKENGYIGNTEEFYVL